MDSDNRKTHLSQIETQWTAVFQAHRAGGGAAQAQIKLMRRYGGAVHRYLLASLRDPDAADELAQEFALRFLRDDFRRADPSRGRFRDFVKRAIYHLMVDYHRARRKSPRALPENVPEPAEEADWATDLDRCFLESWRGTLMARAWAALEEIQERTGQPYATVLRMRIDHPELRSPQMAEALSARLGRSVTANWVRQNLHRARSQFISFLRREVERSLDNPTPECVEEELADLGLLDYCRPALRDHHPDP